MAALDKEKEARFVGKLREELAHAISSMRVRALSEEDRKLLSPAAVTAALLLSGADYASSHGIGLGAFANLVSTLLFSLQNSDKNESV